MRETSQSPNSASALIYRFLRKVGGYSLLACCSLFSLCSGKKLIFITSPFGDLGNRLFLFSNIIAFARENNTIVVHLGLGHLRRQLQGPNLGLIASYPPGRWPKIHSDYFESTLKQLAWAAEAIAFSNHSLTWWRSIRINNSSSMAFEMINLDDPCFKAWFKTKHSLFLSGYQYLASASIQPNQSEIREYLQLAVSESDPLVALHREFMNQHDLLIGVVIRHGDYRHFMEGRYFYETACYADWIKQLTSILPGKKQGFVITGNDGIAPDGLETIDFIFLPHGELATRLILSRCDMIISPPSSYAGWCAFSGNIPLLLITSKHQQMRICDFRPIFNHTDLRDTSMPENIDNTQQVIKKG